MLSESGDDIWSSFRLENVLDMRYQINLYLVKRVDEEMLKKQFVSVPDVVPIFKLS